MVELRRGVVAVAATPFDSANRVDVVSLRRYVAACVQRGVTGVAAPAMAGEAYELDRSERQLVVETIIDAADGRVTIIGGATAATRDERLESVRMLVDVGCDGVLVHVPYEGRPDFAEEYRDIASMSPGFIMLQDINSTSTPLPVEMVAELHADLPALTWAKVEVPDRCRKISALRAATNGTLSVASAGPLMIELLDRGVDIYMPTLYHGVYAEVIRRYDTGDRYGAVDLFNALLPNLVFHSEHPDMAHVMNKRMLAAEGLYSSDGYRIQQRLPDDVEARLMEELIQSAIRLSTETEKPQKVHDPRSPTATDRWR